MAERIEVPLLSYGQIGTTVSSIAVDKTNYNSYVTFEEATTYHSGLGSHSNPWFTSDEDDIQSDSSRQPNSCCKNP